MINWAYFPKSSKATDLSIQVVDCFKAVESEISSDKHTLKSDEALREVSQGLVSIGFAVESGKKKAEKIEVPVLFGINGKVEKSFNADAFHQAEGFVLEVEAGRATVNHQFLKDLFQACMMHDVHYLGIAVRNMYEAALCRGQNLNQFN